MSGKRLDTSQLQLFSSTSKATRGKGRRQIFDTSPTKLPPVIPTFILHRLGGLLAAESKPLVDELTAYYAMPATVQGVANYVSVAARTFKAPATSRVAVRANGTDEVKDLMAKLHRREGHIATNACAELWQLQAPARFRSVAFQSLTLDRDTLLESNEYVRHVVADAVVDLGHTLQGSSLLRLLPFRDLPKSIIHTGEYSVTHPEYLNNVPALIDITAAEQRKRVEYWGVRRMLMSDVWRVPVVPDAFKNDELRLVAMEQAGSIDMDTHS